VFFFNRKKLTAIDGKVDLIQEQLEQNTHKIDEIMLNLHKLDNRLEVIEEQVEKNSTVLSQAIKEVEDGMSTELSCMLKDLNNIRDEVNTSIEKVLVTLQSSLQSSNDEIKLMRTDILKEHSESSAKLIEEVTQSRDIICNSLIEESTQSKKSINEFQSNIKSDIDRIKELLNGVDEDLNSLSKTELAEVSLKLQLIMNEIHLVKNDTLQEQREVSSMFNKRINETKEELKAIVSEAQTVNHGKVEKFTQELESKLDMMESSLKLLLLNSVMEQIK
jgi:hypothetical protein